MGGGGGGGATAITATTTASEIEEWYVEGQLYEPVWYNQNSGWEGRTYNDASSFCARNHAGGSSELCKYEVLCPTGPREIPIGGVIENYSENDSSSLLVQWTAIADSYNDWVVVGPGHDVCRTYVSVHYENPIWGLTGEGSEEMTEAIICCRKATASTADSENDAVTSTTPNLVGGAGRMTTQLPSALDEVEIQANDVTQEIVANEVAQSYDPVWYTHDTGWEGQAYDKAMSFCKSFGRWLCNFNTYCPMGTGNTPYMMGLNQTLGESKWAPLGNAYNYWVQVGIISELECVPFDSMNEWPTPSWGISGEGSYGFTGQLMCCNGVDSTQEEVKEVALTLIEEASPSQIHAEFSPAVYNRSLG